MKKHMTVKLPLHCDHHFADHFEMCFLARVQCVIITLFFHPRYLLYDDIDLLHSDGIWYPVPAASYSPVLLENYYKIYHIQCTHA